MTRLGGHPSELREEVRRLGRLGLGLGLLLGGAALVSLGLLDVVGSVAVGLGMPPAVADRLALAVALLVLPGVLVAARTRLPADAGSVPLRAGGVLLGLSITLAILLPAGGSGLSVPLFGYAVGLLLVLGGVLAGPIADGRSAGTGPDVAFQRSPNRGRTGVTPADGGTEEDDDLTFLLDDED